MTPLKSSSSELLYQLHGAQSRQREARSESRSAWVAFCIFFFCYLIWRFFSPSASVTLTQYIGILMSICGCLLLMIPLLIQRGFFGRWMTYLNVLIQVSAVTAAIALDAMAQGPLYALSSMPPLAYALVIALTSFRLQPGLSCFAGGLSALQFFALYALMLRPMILSDLPVLESLDWGVTFMKLVILSGVGVASGLAARTIQKEFSLSLRDTLRMEQIQRTFGRYVSPEIASAILNPNVINTPTQTRAVVLFGDLRGFTSFSSRRSPMEVAEFLNQYFEKVCRCIETKGGVVNKFLGDGFLALFGVPAPLENKQLADLAAIQTLKADLHPLLSPVGLQLGLALHEGDVIAGEIGSVGRCEYTVIGETVNVASRIETLNRPLQTECLASADFIAGLPADIPKKSLGFHPLRGINNPIELFSL